jgi:hypothetical protein
VQGVEMMNLAVMPEMFRKLSMAEVEFDEETP